MHKKVEGGTQALDELLKTLAKVEKIDLSKMSEELEKRKSLREKAAEELEQLKFVRKKKRKVHWKKKKRLEREKYFTRKKPARARKKAALLREEGWYGYLRSEWVKRNIPWEVSQEDWESAVGTLDDCVPLVTRYDAALGIRLDNILIRDRDTLRVRFDGKEHLLRALGYIL